MDATRAGTTNRLMAGLCALAWALVLVGWDGCGPRDGLVLTPVVVVEPAPDEPFATDPLFAPDLAECGDRPEREVVLASGEKVRIRALIDGEAEPLFVASSDVAFVELDEGTEVAREEGVDPSAAPQRHAAYAVLEGEGQTAWAAFATTHAQRYVLVAVGDRPVDLFRPLGWTRGVRLGVFPDADARARFVAELPFAKP